MLSRPTAADGEEIVDLVRRAGVFVRADVECVRELLHDYFHKPDGGGYTFVIDRRDGEIAGIICYGPTPLTEGTYDLYWLAVAPEARRGGVASALLAHLEADIRARGARLLVVETSGTDAYGPARGFYLARGFQRQATIPDFYAPGDDLVIYTKRLTAG